MGWYKEPESSDRGSEAWFLHDDKSLLPGNGFYWIRDFKKYETSWDWLMPVVAKFRDLVLHGERQGEHNLLMDRIDVALYWTEIKDTYEILVEGIKWYNQHGQA